MSEISIPRTEEAERKQAERIELIIKLKRDEVHGYSHAAIAQMHNLNESTVRTLLGFDVYKVSFEQLGTGRRTTIDVIAPMGTRYEDVVDRVKKELG